MLDLYEGYYNSIPYSYLRGGSGEQEELGPPVLSAVQNALQSGELPPHGYQ